MDLLLIASMVVGIWVFFAITGNERDRRMQKLQYDLDQARRLAEVQLQKPDEVPVIR